MRPVRLSGAETSLIRRIVQETVDKVCQDAERGSDTAPDDSPTIQSDDTRD